jgi:hypothetical protein
MNKIFCIGLHKTGTSTLHELAIRSKYKSIHSVNWQRNIPVINKYKFFCDGGSHYNDLNEFNYKTLVNIYPNCKFVINIRDIRPWIISKCKHAGWNEDTNIIYSYVIPQHDSWTWRIKSLSNIKHFIDHYCDWYIKVIEYFMDKKDKAIIVDIEKQYNVDKLKTLLNNPTMIMVHVNKSKKKNLKLPNIVLSYIDFIINDENREKIEKLKFLIEEFDKK